MTEIMPLLSLLGSLIGTLGGIIAANKLTTFRIERLENEMSKNNNLITEQIERVYKLEGRMTAAEHDIRDLKQNIRRGSND